MVGVLYKPANQQVALITTRNDRAGGQGPSSPTLSGRANNNGGLSLGSFVFFVNPATNSGSLPSSVTIV